MTYRTLDRCHADFRERRRGISRELEGCRLASKLPIEEDRRIDVNDINTNTNTGRAEYFGRLAAEMMREGFPSSAAGLAKLAAHWANVYLRNKETLTS